MSRENNPDVAEDNLKELEYYKRLYQELKLIVDTEFDQVTIADQNGVFLKVERNCEKIFGVPENEMVGKNAREIEEKGIVSKSVTLCVIKNKKKISLVQDTGAGKRLMVKGIPMFDQNGELIRVINISRDITEIEKLNQQLADAEEMLDWFREELLKKQVIETNAFATTSQKMKKIHDAIRQVANTDATVLLLGETGVGKGFLAKTLHQLGKRRDKPFIHINCGAIPINLLESELFGYEAGAFTGANKNGKKGLFEIAQNGTLFLDEIADIPKHIQVKLLNVLQDKKFYKIGGLIPVELGANIIAATNKDLKKLTEEGKFRKDLYYRLNVFPIHVPPLRERVEDIPVLAKYFLDRFNIKYCTNKSLSSDVYNLLTAYSWPGNIRELENTIERLVITSQNRVIGKEELLEMIKPERARLQLTEIIPLKQAVQEVETQLLLKALEKYKTTRKAAEVLQIDQSTVVKKLKKIKKN